MISLIITIFISLFSFCSSNFKVVTEDISKPILLAVDVSRTDSTSSTSNREPTRSGSGGNYNYYTSGDFVSSLFITNLIDYCVASYNIPFLSYNNTTNVGNYLIRNDVGIFEIGTINTDSGAFNNPINITQIYITKSFFDGDTYGKNIRYIVDFNDINGNTYGYVTYNKIGNINNFSQPLEVSDCWNFVSSMSNWTTMRYSFTFADSFIYNVFNYKSDTVFQDGYNQGYGNGYQVGYSTGLNDSLNYDSVASSIFEGIFDVGLLPVNVFLTIFNFEVFGINIAGIVSGLLTLSVVVIILRFLLGGKKDD